MMSYGSIMSSSIESSQFDKALIRVTGPKTGSTVTVSNGTETLTAVEDNGVWEVSVDVGNWSVSCGSFSISQVIEVSSPELYEVNLIVADPILENNDWFTIRYFGATKKVADKIWNIGDEKSLKLNGKVCQINFNNATVKAVIVNIKKYTIGQIVFQIGKWNDLEIAFVDKYYNTKESNYSFNLSTTNTNIGGYKGLSRYNAILGHSRVFGANTFIHAIPNDLYTVINSSPRISYPEYLDNKGGENNTDSGFSGLDPTMLFIPSEINVFGVSTYSNQYSNRYQEQWSYFKAGNGKIAYSHLDKKTPVSWWLNSACVVNNTSFCEVNENGEPSFSDPVYSKGIRPCFCL